MLWMVLAALALGAEPARPWVLAQPGAGPARPLEDSPAEAIDAARNRMRFGQNRQAVARLTLAASAWPNDPDLVPTLGVACARVDDFACTLIHTEGEELTGGFPNQLIQARSAALRAVGRGAEAATLRADLLLQPNLQAPREAGIWTEIAEDLRQAGETAAAYEAAMMALSLDPEAPGVYAALAEQALDRGDPDEAEAQLWLAGLRASGNPKAAANTRARFAVEVEAPLGAVDTVTALIDRNRNSPELAFWMAEAFRRAGQPRRARRLADRPVWQSAGEVWNPGLLAMQALAHFETGDRARAQEALDRAASFYPGNPIVKAAVAALDGLLRPRAVGPGTGALGDGAAPGG